MFGGYRISDQRTAERVCPPVVNSIVNSDEPSNADIHVMWNNNVPNNRFGGFMDNCFLGADVRN